MEKQNEEEEEQKKKKKSSVVIRIPSYQEVVESSQAKSTPSSLFVPSQTFSEAFAFVKASLHFLIVPTFLPLSQTLNCLSPIIVTSSHQTLPSFALVDNLHFFCTPRQPPLPLFFSSTIKYNVILNFYFLHLIYRVFPFFFYLVDA